MTTHSSFLTELSKISPNSTFLTLVGYKNSIGEVSNYSIVFNSDYTTALKKSIAILENYEPDSDIDDYSGPKAKAELLASLYSSLDNITNGKNTDSTYTHFGNASGTDFMKGVKLHEASNTLYIFGLIVHKKVITAVDKKRKEKSVKQKMMEMLPVSRFRQFRISSKNVHRVSVQNMSLLPPDAQQ
jgi:hypothetical protein